MRRIALVTVIAACWAAAPTSADDGDFSGILIGFGGPAFTELSQWDMRVQWEGSVTVRYAGAGQSGSIVWTPGRIGQFTAATGRDRGGHKAYDAFLGSTGGQMTVARVTRGERVCSDWRRTIFDNAAITGGATGVDIALTSASPSGEGFRLTETNCGGPLPASLVHALPSVHVPAAKLRSGGFDLDLRGSGAFTDGSLEGTVESTVVAHLGRRQRTPLEAPPQRRKLRRFRELDVRYRVDPVAGSVTASFAGSELCDELASCGNAGTWLLRPRGTGSVGIFVSAPASRPLRDLRTAAGLMLNGNPRGISAGGGGSWASSSTLTATTSGPRAEDQCSDTRAGDGGALRLDRDGRFMNVTVYAGFGVTRTSCPGPGLAEDASSAPLATARVPMEAFARKRIRIVARRASSVATDGWAGTISPRLTIVLRRTRERASIYRDDS